MLAGQPGPGRAQSALLLSGVGKKENACSRQPGGEKSGDLLDRLSRLRQHRREQLPCVHHLRPYLQFHLATGRAHALRHAHRVVAGVLLLGLANMMRGGSPNTSQKLMRLRVLMQFIAIIVLMATVWFLHR